MLIKFALTAICLLGATHHAAVAGFAKYHDPVSGDYDITFSVAGQGASGTMNLKLDGKKVTGTVDTAHTGHGLVTDGKWEGGKFTCTVKFTSHEDVVMSGGEKDGKLSGEFKAEGNTGQWVATKHAPSH